MALYRCGGGSGLPDFISANMTSAYGTVAGQSSFDMVVTQRPKMIVIVTSRTDMTGDNFGFLWSDYNNNNIKGFGYLNGTPTESNPIMANWLTEVSSSKVTFFNRTQYQRNIYILAYY